MLLVRRFIKKGIFYRREHKFNFRNYFQFYSVLLVRRFIKKEFILFVIGRRWNQYFTKFIKYCYQIRFKKKEDIRKNKKGFCQFLIDFYFMVCFQIYVQFYGLRLVWKRSIYKSKRSPSVCIIITRFIIWFFFIIYSL